MLMSKLTPVQVNQLVITLTRTTIETLLISSHMTIPCTMVTTTLKGSSTRPSQNKSLVNSHLLHPTSLRPEDAQQTQICLLRTSLNGCLLLTKVLPKNAFLTELTTLSYSLSSYSRFHSLALKSTSRLFAPEWLKTRRPLRTSSWAQR